MFGVYILHAAVNDNGIQIGAVQQVLITQTEVLLVQVLVLVHASNNEQTTCGPHKDVLRDVSDRLHVGRLGHELVTFVPLVPVAFFSVHKSTEQPDAYRTIMR